MDAHEVHGPEDLPPGWISRVSKSKNRVYYYNTKTGESVWEKPVEKQEAPEVRASHLLVKHKDSRRPSSWKQETITRTKEEAIEILRGYRTRIVKGEITLGDLATKESDCSSAKNHGDLGTFGRNQMQKAFEDVAFGLAVGELSDIVSTDSGVHIIERTG